MKISIVTGAFFPVPPVLGGGVERLWFGLGREFARLGHQVTHVSRRYGADGDHAGTEGLAYRQVGGFDAPRSLVWLKALDLLYSLRVLKQLPAGDILVTNTFWLPMFAPRSRVGKICVNVQRYPRGQMMLYWRASLLHAPSHAIAEAISAQAPFLRPKISVIPNPVIEPGTDDAGSEREPDRTRDILFVGRLHPEKGIELLIGAFRLLPPALLKETRLLIVGSAKADLGGGGERYMARLERLAAPVHEKIQWLGPVFDSQELAALYRNAHVFVYPTMAGRGEAFPLAPLEAMSHGCPAIVSDIACFRDYVAHGVNGLVFDHLSRDASARLAHAVAGVLEEPQRRREMAAAARSKAAEFSVNRIASLLPWGFRRHLPRLMLSRQRVSLLVNERDVISPGWRDCLP